MDLSNEKLSPLPADTSLTQVNFPSPPPSIINSDTIQASTSYSLKTQTFLTVKTIKTEPNTLASQETQSSNTQAQLNQVHNSAPIRRLFLAQTLEASPILSSKIKVFTKESTSGTFLIEPDRVNEEFFNYVTPSCVRITQRNWLHMDHQPYPQTNQTNQRPTYKSC